MAQRLLVDPTWRVLGIDRVPPVEPLAGLDFVKADIRNPLLGELLRAEQVAAVVHLAWRERQWGSEDDFESNVLGTMQLVGACAEAGVQQVVLRGTMAVYGARAENPLYMREDTPLAAESTNASVQHSLEVERFIASFAPEYPELRLVVLRFAHVIGIEADSPLTRLLRLPVLPGLLGFDPLLQLVDVEDAVAALAHACGVRANGAYNVAGDGIVSLQQLAGKLRRPILPILHLLVYWGLPSATGLPGGRELHRWFPLGPDHLRFPCIGDLARMRSDLGYLPRWSALQAVERYAEDMRAARSSDSSAGGQAHAGDGEQRRAAAAEASGAGAS